MQFTRDPVMAVTIRHVERGRLRIGDTEYRRTIAVTAEEVLGDQAWPAVGELAIERLTMEHLEPLLATEPEIVLLGTGWQPALPPRELTFAMARRGIGCEVMDTPAACRTFNILVGEGRRPAAILTLD